MGQSWVKRQSSIGQAFGQRVRDETATKQYVELTLLGELMVLIAQSWKVHSAQDEGHPGSLNHPQKPSTHKKHRGTS